MNKAQLLSLIREKVGQNGFARCVAGVSLSIGGIRFVVDQVTREKAYVTLTGTRTGGSVVLEALSWNQLRKINDNIIQQ